MDFLKLGRYVNTYIRFYGLYTCLLLFCILFTPEETTQKDASSRTLNKSYNCSLEEVQAYSLDDDYDLTEISTNISSTNSTPTAFLANFVQQSGNATDEDGGSTLASRITAVIRKTPVEMRAKRGRQEKEERYLYLISSNGTLKVKKYHCEPVTESAFVALEEKNVLEYPTTLSIVIISFMYTFLSLLCAFICIISVTKFFVMFIVSNFYTYFILCVILTGSFSELLIYFIPFHCNFLLLMVTGWVTLLSCKFVFKQLTARKVFHVVNGEVVGNTSYMFLLAMSLSCFFSMITLLGTPPYDMYSVSHEVRNVYSKLMAHLTPSVILLLLTVMGVDVVFTSLRKRTEDLGVRHTNCYIMFICYHLLAMLIWMYGFVAVNLPAYPLVWQMYLFVSIGLPFSFRHNVVSSHRVHYLLRSERDANIENTFPVRIENV